MTASAVDPYRKALADSVVFEHLAPAELNLIMERCRLVDARAGQLLLSEGTRGDGLYIILEGEVEFFLPQTGAGAVTRSSRMRLNVLGPGRCFGEYGVIDDQPSSASAQALRPTRLCFLSREDFRRIADQHDRLGKLIYLNLLRFLVSRLRKKDKELDLVLLLDESGDKGTT